MSQDIWPGQLTAPLARELVESFINGNINHVANEIVSHPLAALVAMQVCKELTVAERGVVQRAVERTYVGAN